jgi:Kef-type K+ transport system membrane component KefB
VAEHADLLASVGLCVSVAAALAFIANRLKQPLLLAYLLAEFSSVRRSASS